MSYEKFKSMEYYVRADWLYKPPVVVLKDQDRVWNVTFNVFVRPDLSFNFMGIVDTYHEQSCVSNFMEFARFAKQEINPDARYSTEEWSYKLNKIVK